MARVRSCNHAIRLLCYAVHISGVRHAFLDNLRTRSFPQFRLSKEASRSFSSTSTRPPRCERLKVAAVGRSIRGLSTPSVSPLPLKLPSRRRATLSRLHLAQRETNFHASAEPHPDAQHHAQSTASDAGRTPFVIKRAPSAIYNKHNDEFSLRVCDNGLIRKFQR
jgi:hypothetical protein